MSGRSAHVRKKVHEPNKGKGKGKATERRQSSASADYNDVAVVDYHMPSSPLGTGVGTTNARFLKFTDIAPSPGLDQQTLGMTGPSSRHRDPSLRSGASSGSGGDLRRDAYSPVDLDEFGYPRQRRPTIKTEDVSGIERSGLRSMIDKRSDGVRKGIAKTFAFRKKEKGPSSPEYRPASVATVRQDMYGHDHQKQHYDAHQSAAPVPMQAQPARPTTHQRQNPAHQQQLDYQQAQMIQHRWPGTLQDSWENNGMGPPPTGKLPPIPQNQGPPIKRWIGAGRPVQRWNKLRKDPELWDPNGDVLIFLSAKGQQPRPPPSFRLSSHIIEATDSRYLITLLREGFNEDDLYGSSQSPAPPGSAYGNPRAHLSHGYGRGGQPTPPISEDASVGEADGQISYEMYFPTPANLNRTDQLRHQLTTRNVFALLYHASLVGLSLHQALSDVHTRLDGYMPPDSDNVGQIINYLSARGIDDVRSDPDTAVSLLGWSEGQDVRWEEGWRESFFHCVGMHRRLEHCADFKATTPITKALLERAHLEMQLRVQSAEERLADFSFSDMWSASGNPATSPARAAADRLQRMLIGHYYQLYGSWPPPIFRTQTSPAGSPLEDAESGDDDMWLTRTVTASLQRDFGALYDYLVNRDIIWDVSEARSGRKWMMVSEYGNMAFEADTPDLPMTDLIIEFDNKHRLPHIPHPYPLVPESVPPSLQSPNAGARDRSGLFKTTSNRGGEGRPPGVTGAKTGALERRVHLAYTESTNIYTLGSDFTQSDLIDAFVAFEKRDKIGEVDPAIARRGRWVLLYGILQTLASISVDSRGIRYADGVPYHLSPRLKGTKIPPWKGAVTGTSARDEASHELSHCWMVPDTWLSNSGLSSGDESSAASSESRHERGDMASVSATATATTASSMGSGDQGRGVRTMRNKDASVDTKAQAWGAQQSAYHLFPQDRGHPGAERRTADTGRGKAATGAGPSSSFLSLADVSSVDGEEYTRSYQGKSAYRDTPLLERQSDENMAVIRDFDVEP